MVYIDYSKDSLIGDFGIKRFHDGYMLESESSPQQNFARTALAFGDDDEHAQRLYSYMSKLWFMPASPLLSNGGTQKGLPISCFGNTVGDDLKDIGANALENIWLTSSGGGIGTYWGDVRSNGSATSKGSKSTGVIPFIHWTDSQMLAFSQGSTRRGSNAAYLPITHPEIEEFIGMRKPTGGDINRKNLNIHHGVIIPDSFMQIIDGCTEGTIVDDAWELIDPNSKKVVKTISAKALWQSIIETRAETGEPYIMFQDTVNRTQSSIHKELGMTIKQSNLCVAPETLIMTKEYGYMNIKSLKNKDVDVWNGQEWSKVQIKKTGKNQKLLNITFSDGTSLSCTPYHKFYIQDTYNKLSVREVRAEDLLSGMKLEKWNLPLDVKQSVVQVVSVEDTGRFDDTYCATEPKRGRILFNGVVTGNCSEILLPTGVDYLNNNRTFVCCLSSVNLEKFDEWKDKSLFIEDIIRMLDNVLDVFIKQAPEGMSRARYAAQMERSLGLGAMGFHAYLQSKMIPFESAMAVGQNRRMFYHIQQKALEATTILAQERGNCPDVSEYNRKTGATTQRRNVHLMAIAPNASSSILCGNTSPSIEPYAANMFRQETLSGWNIFKNRYLDKLIKDKCGLLPYDKIISPEDVWKDISNHGGSIQHMTEFFTHQELDVFKTSKEIDQRWIIQHASDRYEYVDQAQSVNLFFAPDATIAYLHKVHMDAWRKGLKTLYYLRSSAKHRAENINEKVERTIRPDYVTAVQNDSDCLACEG